ncbi:MAG: nuclease-related domain-containing protein, partial [Acidimicrobiaceae bacterium]|nr:nuclease-related domain-containing protein [Acidimicrobiaceae bacterium]
MTNSTVRLFVGDTIAEPSEGAFLSRLRLDLENLGLDATLYANFFPATNQTRQIDVLIRTDHRTVHVEVKSLQRAYPVRARPNGPWVQTLPDGTERRLDSNGGRQAREGTFAISDAMRELARKGLVQATSEPGSTGGLGVEVGARPTEGPPEVAFWPLLDCGVMPCGEALSVSDDTRFLDRVEAVFDEGSLVGDAGLLLAGT